MPRVLEPEEVEIPLARQSSLIRAHWRWLLVPAALGIVAGAVVALMQPTVYEAASTLMVAQPKFSSDAKPISVSNFRALLQTNTLALAAIARFGLDKPPHNLTAGSLQRDVLIIEEVRNTNLIRAHVRLSDPKLAADVANFLATESVAFNERLDAQESTYYRSQLKSQVDDAAARLRVAEQRLVDFRKTAQLDLVRKDADSALDERGELLRLTMDIETEKARLATAEREIQRQDRVLTVPRNVAGDAALRATAAATAQREAAAGAANREPVQPVTEGERERPEERKPGREARESNDSDRRVQADAVQSRPPANPRRPPETDPLESAQLDFSNPFINPVYQVLDYQIALGRTKIAGLERRRTELMTVLRLGGKDLDALTRLYPQQVELRRLEGEHEITSTLYSEVAQQYERARLQIASNSARLQVVDVAVEPDAPLPRHRALYTLVGLLLGLVAGALTVVVRQAAVVSPVRGAVRPR